MAPRTQPRAAAGPALIGDIGGTHARFALAADGTYSAPVTLAVADYATGDAAVAAALQALGGSAAVTAVRLAVAGPVTGGRANLTNGDWTFDAAALGDAFPGAAVELFNDVQAAAFGLPHLAPSSLIDLNDAAPTVPIDWSQPVGLAMVGTGLGVSCLLPGDAGVALATEAGHVALAAGGADEDAILARLRQRFGRVSAERVLSGQGLANLYAAMTGGAEKPAAAIVADGSGGRDPDAGVLDQFCALLGAVAGDLALAYGAWGGFFLGGGVAGHLADVLPASRFRARFEDKGRFRDRLRDVPSYLTTRDDIALLGLARRQIHPPA